MTQRYIIAFSLLFLSVFVVANDYVFKSYTIEDGLPNNYVRCIEKDQNGYMWFGTHGGVCYYDGYQFKVFKEDISDPHAILSNRVSVIECDQLGNIWVGSNKGVQLYDPVHEYFTDVEWLNPVTGKRKKISGVVSSVCGAHDNEVWISLRGTGLFYRKGSDFFMLNIADPDNVLQKLSKIAPYNDGLLLAHDGGLAYYSKKEGLKAFAKRNRILIRSVDLVDDIAYCGTGKGLWIVNLKTGEERLVNRKVNRKLGSSYIFSVKKYNNQLWVATDGEGIFVLDEDDNIIQQILPNSINKLTSDAVTDMFVDEQERLWLATFRGGANLYDPSSNRFNALVDVDDKEMGLIHNFVSSICVGRDKQVWVGTDGGGVTRWNPRNGKFDHFVYGKNSDELLGNNITSLVEDNEGNIYIGVFRGGLAKYDIKKQRIVSTEIVEKDVWSLYRDQQGDVWVGTVETRDGLYKIDGRTGKVTVYPQVQQIHCIREANNDQLWLGSRNQGLVLFNKSGSVDKIYKEFDSSRKIDNPIRDIEVVGDSVWIGIENVGLVNFDKKKLRFKIYNENNGLCDNSVLNIRKDKQDRLWLGTANGLCMFDPASREVVNYYKSDGLPSSQFSYSASLSHNDELYFGTVGGMVWFSPDSIATHSLSDQINLQEFRVYNTVVRPGGDEEIEMDMAINEVQKIVLPYDKAFFSIDYVVPEYSTPSTVDYAYKLEGLDKEWNQAKNHRTAAYTNVPAGTYEFRVKAGIDGNWNERNKRLIIQVLPPWWRSWWAYLIYLLIIGLIGFGISRVIGERIKLRREIMMAHFAKEKEHELNEEKLRFFTNISHEFRTPLTLIYGGLEQLLKEEGRATVEVKTLSLKRILNNSKRLLMLVNQLINFRLGEKGALKLQVKEGDLLLFVTSIFESFQLKAVQKNINYQLVSDESEIIAWFDEEKLDIMVYNLLSNAFKYTPDNETIILQLVVNDGMVNIVVKDSGIGIPEEDQEKIFDRFFRADNQSGEDTGSGIGLAMVHRYVELHHGKISFTSKEDKGTTFVIELPMSGDHYLASEVATKQTSYKSVRPEEVQEESITDKENQAVVDLNDYEAKLLVIDDNDELREFMNSFFKERYEVVLAEDGNKGYEAIVQHNPDLIISDVMMPEMDGLELCRKVKANIELSHIPLVLLTAKATEEARDEAMLAGANDYVTKPFSIEYLALRIKNLLENQKRLKEHFKEDVVLQPSELELADQDKAFLRQVVELIEEGIGDPDFNVQMLSDQVGMSQSAFYKKTKGITGMSINEFVRNIRMKKAAQYILSRQYNITEAASEVGYSDMKYFRECFKKQFGMTPSAFLKQQ
ncbi:hybrid sensor histidine kinase/response regulator [Puteibacter caeruleilacunae]|nr:hybrid sensor histidine kinase/response regulator [Puteibacter caeruleilacunae]